MAQFSIQCDHILRTIRTQIGVRIRGESTPGMVSALGSVVVAFGLDCAQQWSTVVFRWIARGGGSRAYYSLTSQFALAPQPVRRLEDHNLCN